MFGGIVFGILGGYLYLKYFKEPIGRWADLAAPSLLLGIGIGRAGCLAAGCCYGSRTTSFWGMVFSNPRAAAPLHIPLHPTQALEMLFGLASACAFVFIFRKPCKLSGAAFVWALVVYSAFRFFIEFLRGDLDRGLYFRGRISTSQVLAVGIVLGCVAWFIYYARRHVVKPN